MTGRAQVVGRHPTPTSMREARRVRVRHADAEGVAPPRQESRCHTTRKLGAHSRRTPQQIREMGEVTAG